MVSVRFGSVRFSLIRVDSVLFESVRFGSVQFSMRVLGLGFSVQIGAEQNGLKRCRSDRTGSVPTTYFFVNTRVGRRLSKVEIVVAWCVPSTRYERKVVLLILVFFFNPPADW